MRTTLLLLLFSSIAAADGLRVDDGEVTMTPFDADLSVVFDPTYQNARVNLNSDGLDQTFSMKDAGISLSDTLFFETENGNAKMALTMDPLGQLNDDTIMDIVNVDFSWAHPALNNPVDPTVFLQMSAPPSSIVPEVSAVCLFLLGIFSLIFKAGR